MIGHIVCWSEYIYYYYYYLPKFQIYLQLAVLILNPDNNIEPLPLSPLSSKQNQPPPNMMKQGPPMMQSLPPPNSFNVPNQGPPPSLLQPQMSAASLAPLLQNPPQPLLPQPPPKGRPTEDPPSCDVDGYWSMFSHDLVFYNRGHLSLNKYLYIYIYFLLQFQTSQYIHTKVSIQR